MDARTLKDQADDALRSGPPGRAAELLEKLVTLEPNTPQHFIKLGDAHRLDGRIPEAIAAYHRAVLLLKAQHQGLKAIAVSKSILELDPSHLQAVDDLSQLAREESIHPGARPPAAPDPFAAPPSSRTGSVAVLPTIRRDRPPELVPPPEASQVPRPIPILTPVRPARPAATLPPGGVSAVLRAAEQASATSFSAIGQVLTHPVQVANQSRQAVLLASPRIDIGTPLPVVNQAAIPLFTDVSPEAFRDVLRQMEVTRYRAEAPILLAGTRGSSLYILASGRASVVKSYGLDDEQELTVMEEGAFFGEISLLTGAPRTASVIAAEDSVVFTLSDALLQRLTRQYPTVQRALLQFYRERLVKSALSGSPLFQHVPPDARSRFVTRFEIFAAGKDEILLAEGQPPQGLFVLLLGDALVTQVDVDGEPLPIAVMHEGDVLGEMSLVTGNPVSATVTTLRKSMFLFLPRDSFDEVMEEFPGARETVLDLSDARTQLDADRRLGDGMTLELV